MALANCSHCHKPTEVQLRQSINVAEDPELKARVKDGSLFVWECPYCGHRNLAKYQTLYHDPQAKLMVWLLPGEEMPPKAVEEAVKELDGYTLRRVREVGDLIEKVNILADNGEQLPICHHRQHFNINIVKPDTSPLWNTQPQKQIH